MLQAAVGGAQRGNLSFGGLKRQICTIQHFLGAYEVVSLKGFTNLPEKNNVNRVYLGQ